MAGDKRGRCAPNADYACSGPGGYESAGPCSSVIKADSLVCCVPKASYQPGEALWAVCAF